jgi:hypothetical protein
MRSTFEPDVRVEASSYRLPAKLAKTRWTAVVGREGEKRLVERIDRLAVKMAVDDEPDVLDARYFNEMDSYHAVHRKRSNLTSQSLMRFQLANVGY